MTSLHLTLLHTNDLHGRVNQLTRIGTLVRSIRQEVELKEGYCLYVDAGDCEDSILLESALTKGSAMDAILRGAGCDQVVLGNAIPFRYGIQAIAGLAERFGKPILCANMQWKDGSIPEGIVPYVIEDLNGFKLGIIGLTAPIDAYQPFNVSVKSPREIAPGLIEQLKSEGARFIILLSHLGKKYDLELVEVVDGIDIIIGGHSHDRIYPPLLVNNTVIVQAGQYGEVLGRLDLEIDRDSGDVLSHRAELIQVDEELLEDSVVLSVVEQEKQRAKRIMDIEIGCLRNNIDYLEGKESDAGNLLADALLSCYPDGQVAFVMGEHWEEGLKAGILTKGTLFSVNRSTGNPGIIKVTGKQLEQFFLTALNPENINKRTPQMRGRMNGVPHVAGMRIIAHGHDPDSVELFIGDRKIRPDEIVTAVISDFEISEILNYLPIPDAQVDYDIPTILPEVLEKYIRQHGPIGEIKGNRISFLDQE